MDVVKIYVPELSMIKGNSGKRILDKHTKVWVRVKMDIKPPKIPIRIPAALKRKETYVPVKLRRDRLEPVQGIFDPRKDCGYIIDDRPIKKFSEMASMTIEPATLSTRSISRR